MFHVVCHRFKRSSFCIPFGFFPSICKNENIDSSWFLKCRAPFEGFGCPASFFSLPRPNAALPPHRCCFLTYFASFSYRFSAASFHPSICSSSAFSPSFLSNLHPLRICVVGSGPSGFYSAKYILKEIPSAKVDMIEKLPTPFGLVRYGVAPDHPEIKVVTKDFDVVAQNQNFRFFGNVQLGEKKDETFETGAVLSVDELRVMYDAIILAYGASEDKKLGIEGENMLGVISARKFVGWYNGHPEEVQHMRVILNNMNKFDRENRKNGVNNVVIIGNGNVALDVARIFGKAHEELKKSDITTEAAEWLFENSVKKIFIVGRRGWGQCSFTTKELRGILEDESMLCVLQPKIYEECLNETTKEEVKGNRVKQRQQKLMEKMANNYKLQKNSSKKIVEFLFLFSPEKIIGDNGRVSSVVLRPNKLEGEISNQNPCRICTFVDWQFTAKEWKANS